MTRPPASPTPPADSGDTLNDAPASAGADTASLGTAHTVALSNPAATSTGHNASIVDPARASLDEAGGFSTRYQLRRMLGVGGMGEVRLCRDRRIGRDVALKVLHGNLAHTADAQARFVREARVQGQLEHPSVVPVYDLGEAPDGTAFFTMKRVAGLTLEEIIAGLADDASGVAQRYSRRKLLTAFGSVCLAVDFAHTRGVLHRDLKPANVMLGDFGEVHVLDWGLAHLAGSIDTHEAHEAPADSIDQGAGKTPQTHAGSIMGTPGYMAPEQARGETDQLDARTDVYALGAILFELLALQPLHAAGSITAALTSTMTGADARPSVRAPERDVPPELDAICVRATALDPRERFPSARALSDAVERYLDGDRDVQRRRELAAAHATAAEQARARMHGSENPADVRVARGVAMREVTRALALDPDHAGALRALAQLLTEVPRELPPEAEAEVALAAGTERERAARAVAVRYATWVAFFPLFARMGIRSMPLAVITGVAVTGALLFALALWRRGRPGVSAMLWLMAASSLAIGFGSTLFGPVVLIPGLAATNTIFFSMSARRRDRVVIAGAGVLTMLVPFALEWLGIVSPWYGMSHDAITINPRMLYFTAAPTLLVLFGASVAMTVTPTLLVGRLREALSAAERRLLMHSWHLRQLVPDAARPTLEDTTRKP